VSELPVPSAEPRQRWRLVVARQGIAAGVTQRDVAAAWVEALEGSGIPLAGVQGARGRSRLAFGAPLPAGMAAERELIDVVLTERWPLWRLRASLARRIPEGWRLIDAFDVWLGGPPLPARVIAADYRIELANVRDVSRLTAAAAGLLDAEHARRERQKGGATVAYDLRPLIVDVTVAAGPPVVVRARTRFDPELGTGRPEEVIGALSDRLGEPLEIASMVRERLVLDED
jgi:radical SAM-linked protein